MSVPVLILADSGAGKSTSLRNLDPKMVLVIQPIKKPLPFRSKEWGSFGKDSREGAIFHTSDYLTIQKVIASAVSKCGKKIIVIDDSNYLMTLGEMSRSHETGFTKFTEFAKNHLNLITFCQSLPDDVTVYFMSHTQIDAHGNSKPKTTGKMLDEKIVLEGLFSVVLGCHVKEGRHYFTTRNSGTDCVKTPIGLFDEEEIDNDLAIVDKALREYY